jgi:uncharacterized protein YdhG (YjbR/CyaY superfamily)
MGELNEYLETVSAPGRAALARVRDLALQECPDAEESRSYGMAALRFRGKPLLGFVAAKAHLSVFPFSPEAVEAVAAELAGFSLSKGTIRFTADRPLPDSVVRELVRTRMAQITR